MLTIFMFMSALCFIAAVAMAFPLRFAAPSCLIGVIGVVSAFSSYPKQEAVTILFTVSGTLLILQLAASAVHRWIRSH